MSPRSGDVAAREHPFDPGLQPERTLLAWRRTALTLAVGSAIGVRVTLDDLGPGAVVIGVVGLTLAATAYVGAGARHRREHESLTVSGVHASGGMSIAAAALAVVILGVGALAWVLSRA